MQMVSREDQQKKMAMAVLAQQRLKHMNKVNLA